MSKSNKTLEFKFERLIPASPDEAYDAWLDPKVPGNTWNIADKFMIDLKVDGLFYWYMKDACHHYGRFTKVDRPSRLEHTWVSPNTLGEESIVTVTFKKQGDQTLMTLVHSNLPDSEEGREHEKGWNYFLGIFPEHFLSGKRKKK